MSTTRFALVLALASGLCCIVAFTRGETPATTTLAPAAHPVALSDLPIRRITLYRSGVASFERRGTVLDDEVLRLKFETAQVNDVLKTLVAADFSGTGTVKGVSYASNAPLARRLAAFGINLGDEPSLAALLGRLRGTNVAITLPEGQVAGTILGGETREEAAGNSEKPIAAPYLNIVTAKGIRSINLNQARGIELADPELQEELALALTAIAQQRQERSRALDVSFAGKGEREVGVLYTHEAPVWKASYRVLLDQTKPTRLNGWAVVENTTDEDWNDVRLSLVSGRPVSFTMDLQEPLFAYRPAVAVPAVGGLAPRVYAEAMIGSLEDRAANVRQLQNRLSLANSQQTMDKLEARREVPAPSSPVLAGLDERGAGQTHFDYAELVASSPAAAMASQTGEVFHYDVSTPTTIARQSSAMIPILSSDVKTRRVSILSPGADNQTRYPMRGLELTNSSELQLLPGPLAIYDSGVYAGDAMIEQIAPGDTRLLSYATDLEVVAVSRVQDDSDMIRLRIVNGSFEQTRNSVHKTIYKLRNKNEKTGRTVILEQAKMPGYSFAGGQKPSGETGSLDRFEVDLKPGEKTEFVVTQESRGTTIIGLNTFDDRTILAWQQSGKVSPKVLEAVREVSRRQAAIKQVERKIADLDAEWKRISDDQNRTRENMRTIDRNSDLYTRYMKKFADQETQGEQIGAENIGAKKQLRELQDELNRFISELNVE
ncbi:MAG: hypothetical protein U0570_15015 [Phycisphaerales bacterium]